MTCLTRLHALLHREPWWAEWWSATGAIAWACWIVWQPLELADREPYQVISFIASDAQWACIGLIIGATQLVAVSLDHRWARFGAAFLAGLFWVCLAYGLWLGNMSAPGAAVYAVLGAANMTSLVLLNLNKR